MSPLTKHKLRNLALSSPAEPATNAPQTAYPVVDKLGTARCSQDEISGTSGTSQTDPSPAYPGNSGVPGEPQHQIQHPAVPVPADLLTPMAMSIAAPMTAASARPGRAGSSSTVNGSFQQPIEANPYSSNKAPDTQYSAHVSNPSYYAERAAQVSSTNWISSAQYGTSNLDTQWPSMDFNSVDVNTGFLLQLNTVLPLENTAFVGEVAQGQSQSQSQGQGSSASFQSTHRSSASNLQATIARNDKHQPGPCAEPRDSDQSAASRGSNTYYVDGCGARAPFNRAFGQGRLESIKSRASSYCSSPPNFGLPNREILHPSDDSIFAFEPLQVSEGYYNFMVQAARNECHGRSLPVDWSLFPSLSQTRELVQLYADKFHPVFAFLVNLTFSSQADDNWILLIAIATYAATYTPGLTGSRQVRFLQDLLRSLLTLWRDEDVQAGLQTQWTPSFMEASCQHSEYDVHVTHRGPFLMRRVFIERFHLVEACQRRQLIARAVAASGDASSIRHRDAERRAGMMIWLLDSMLPYQLGCEPLLQIVDMQAPLPTHDNPLGRVTGQQTLQMAERDETITILDALELLHIEKRLPRVSELGMKLVIYAICRNMKELSVRNRVQLQSWTPTAQAQIRAELPVTAETWPPATEMLSHWRNSACDCLDIIHWRANSKIAKASGWEHSTIYHLHFVRLLLLSPLKQIQTIAAASRSSNLTPAQQMSGVDSREIFAARNHVLQWALRDQHKARLAVVHSGALLWHIRRFSTYSFPEPFGIYSATLIIWAYSQCVGVKEEAGFVAGRQNEATAAASKGGGINACGKDVDGGGPASVSENEAATGAAMATSTCRNTHECPEAPIIQVDRPCDDEIIQSFVLLGTAMSARMQGVGNIHKRGAPVKILNEGLKLLRRVQESDLDLSLFLGDKRESEGAAAGHQELKLEQSYATLLEEMMKTLEGL
ncbi:hypothetical protein E4U43_000074 [Claviceps pusilla]|uniref:Transcription factor domain-containing protein n=1 Tax=Claviceps pusilla TaxID=123648 RepID=A0A9P7NAT1_9HYPO|nr:hypothetical protein E4U43_000074 [Claviceps pusilla]